MGPYFTNLCSNGSRFSELTIKSERADLYGFWGAFSLEGSHVRVEEDSRVLCSSKLSLGVWGRGDLGSPRYINGPRRLP